MVVRDVPIGSGCRATLGTAEGGRTWLRFTGELDLAVVPDIDAMHEDLARVDRIVTFELNLADVSYLDLPAHAALQRLVDRIATRGAAVVMIAPARGSTAAHLWHMLPLVVPGRTEDRGGQG